MGLKSPATGALAWELTHLAAGAAIAGENPSEAGNLAWNAFLDVLQTRVKLAVKAADVPKTLHVLLDALAFVVGLRAAAPDPSYPIPKDVMPSPSSFIDVPDWVAARGLAFVLEWIKQQL